MNFKELASKRKSVRSYKDELIPDNTINQILEAAALAPSACNYQPWYYIMVDDKQLLNSIHEAYPREWFDKTQQLIVVCGDHQQSWKRSFDAKDHCDIDVAITVDHLTLMAAELGVGTCWVCHFDADKVKTALKLPSHIEPVVIVPFGYPTDDAIAPKPRKTLDKLVFRNEFKH
jgi:nitroreductase